MTTLIHETWEGAVLGAAPTTGNTAWTTINSGWLVDGTHIPTGQGANSAKLVRTASNAVCRKTVTTASAVFEEIWLWPTSAPSINVSLANFRNVGDTATLSDIQVWTDMSVVIRNSGFIKIASSPAGALKANQWNKIQRSYDNASGQQRLRLFTTDPYGNSPDYDSGLVTTTKAGAVGLTQIGMIASVTWTAWFGDYDLNTDAFLVAGGGGGGSVTPHGSTVNATTGTGATATVTIPGTVSAGDELVLQFFGTGTQPWTVTTPAGWSKLNMSQASSVNTFEAYRKTAAGGDAGSTVTVTSNNVSGSGQFNRVLQIDAFTGGFVNDCGSRVGDAAALAHACPSVTAISPHAMILNGCWDRGTAASTSWSVPANLTKRTEYTAMVTSLKASGVTATDDEVGAGSVGSNTITGTLSTDAFVTSTIVIEPTGTVTAITVSAGPDLTVEPWRNITITPVATGGVPDSWSWTQTAAQATTPSPNGGVDDPVDLTAGATVDSDGTIHIAVPASVQRISYTLRAIAHKSGHPDTGDNMILDVWPATRWFLTAAGVLVPIRYQAVI